MLTRDVHAAALDIASAIDVETTLERLVDSTRRLLGAASVDVHRAHTEDGRPHIAPLPVPDPLHNDGGVPAYEPAAAELTGGKSLLAAPLIVPAGQYGWLHVGRRLGGGSFTEEDEATLLCLASAGGVALANALHFEAMRGWLRASAELGMHLPLNFQDARNAIVNQALSPSTAALAAYVLPTSDRSFARCEAAAGGRAPLVLRKVLNLSDSIAAAVLESGLPAVCQTSDLVGEQQADGLGEALLAPLMPHGGEPGLLILCRESGASPFQPLELELAGAFCNHAALSLELAQSQRLREQLVLFADRDRIARDLHDVVIQRLFAAGLSIQSLRRYTGDEAAHQRIAEVTQELDEAILELRDTIYSLQADSDQALSSRLFRTLQEGTSGHAAKPRLEITGPVDSVIPHYIAEHLLAVATEGVSNAVRHSAAAAIDVSIAVEDHTVRLRIEDDGCGFEAPVRRSGLANMEQRALDLDGNFEVRTRPGEGTRLTWTVPLPHREPDPDKE
ncbi:histidine kinase with GAF domain [Arthrobacter crystallopoietes BAB-32]|uniref:Histidine kinase with GAF domain n=1 Tax=Arthrobacter crystallopoietes BAB-32 TaxID=1246476 RepID=N1UY95_9MICC|nr:GAF domain-containing sensor histidine kinase [Arthrobacter crystallopoietes]EMY34040.1 histidine kinase with GAF domain [Arthrobacter crystallopoietes BAB-32]